MLRLLFLLMGGPALRAAWPLLIALGLFSATAATAIVLDIVDDGYLSVPLCLLGLFLVIEGAIEIPAALDNSKGRWPALAKSCCLILAGAAVVIAPDDNSLCVSLLFATIFLFDGGFRVIACGLMRCRLWRRKLTAGVLEMALSALIYADWPLPHHAILPLCFAALLLRWSSVLLTMAHQIHALPAETSVAALPMFTDRGLRRPHGLNYPHPAYQALTVSTPLSVYIWTPLGSGDVAGRRPWFDRWVAAIDHRGMVSTGHTSLEMGEEMYISLYPQDDIERDVSGFLLALRAREEFDVEGRFLTSLQQEINNWCLPDRRLQLEHYNQAALRNYWAAYRTHTTYNLTSRNCSTSVMQALDVATEGMLGTRGVRGFTALLDPNFWLLSLVRSRAEGMTWTPGLVMDYVTLLRQVLEPDAARGWRGRFRQLLAWRRAFLSTVVTVKKPPVADAKNNG